MTSHSASVRFCALIDADMWRVRRTSRLMRFLSLGIGQTWHRANLCKSARFPRKSRRALCRRPLLATAGSHSGAVASASGCTGLVNETLTDQGALLWWVDA